MASWLREQLPNASARLNLSLILQLITEDYSLKIFVCQNGYFAYLG